MSKPVITGITAGVIVTLLGQYSELGLITSMPLFIVCSILFGVVYGFVYIYAFKQIISNKRKQYITYIVLFTLFHLIGSLAINPSYINLMTVLICFIPFLGTMIISKIADKNKIFHVAIIVGAILLAGIMYNDQPYFIIRYVIALVVACIGCLAIKKTI